MRLDRVIANNSVYSRKNANTIIKKGNVLVNNTIIKDPSFQINILKDEIKIYNKILSVSDKYYFVLNKPVGYVCSNSNKEGQSVLNLIKQNYIKNLHIVGRLDKDTTGLLIITNDGEFTHKIKSSKYNIEKEYQVKLEKELSKDNIKFLKNEIYLSWKEIKPFQLNYFGGFDAKITLIEGKFHQIKKIFKLVNNKVIKLKRIRIGKLELDNLNLDSGQYLVFSNDKIKNLIFD